MKTYNSWVTIVALIACAFFGLMVQMDGPVAILMFICELICGAVIWADTYIPKPAKKSHRQTRSKRQSESRRMSA